MIDQRLLQYLEESLKAGYSLEQTKNTLLNNGFSASIVDEAIYSLTNRKISNEPKIKAGNEERYEYAGFWYRLSASFWDLIILGIPNLLFNILIVYFLEMNALIYLVNLIFLILILYLDGIRGGTPGKKILGLKIVNKSNKYVGIPTAILRYIGKIISTLILGIGYLMIAWHPKKQGLHDRIAGTYVIKTKEKKVLMVFGIVICILFLISIPILIAIGSLAYFGVMNPGNFIPEKCEITEGFECLSSNFEGNVLTLTLQNKWDYSVNSLTVSTESICDPRVNTLNSGETATFSCPVYNVLNDNMYIGAISINYATEGGEFKSTGGTITIKSD
ncbi:RDD family protein [Candidatus Woesearchaeota archaeon]|nr:RDD family protein [Candidatus Woesearchaeota archaeon]